MGLKLHGAIRNRRRPYKFMWRKCKQNECAYLVFTVVVIYKNTAAPKRLLRPFLPRSRSELQLPIFAQCGYSRLRGATQIPDIEMWVMNRMRLCFLLVVISRRYSYFAQTTPLRSPLGNRHIQIRTRPPSEPCSLSAMPSSPAQRRERHRKYRPYEMRERQRSQELLYSPM